MILTGYTWYLLLLTFFFLISIIFCPCFYLVFHASYFIYLLLHGTRFIFCFMKVPILTWFFTALVLLYVVMLPTVMIFTIFTWYFLLLHFISLYLMVLFEPLCYFTHLVFHVTYWFYQFCLVGMVLSNLDTHYIVPTSFHWYIMVLTVLFHICHGVYRFYLVLH